MTFKTHQLALSASLILLLTACGGGDSKSDDPKNPGPGNITGETIAKIEEASGICYSADRGSLFVVSDKGVIYELDMSGEILAEERHRTKKDKKYDFEGIACDDDNGRVVVAREGKDNVVTIKQNDLSSRLKDSDDKDMGDIVRPDDDTLFKDEDGKTGIEGIAINDGTVYISNQSLVAYPGQDSSFVFTVNDYTAAEPEVDEIVDHGKLDIVGLSFHNGFLYMVSGVDHSLIQYDIDAGKVLSTKRLPSGIDVEGVTFDNDGNIYFADDKNGKVYKYSASDFGIN